MAGLENVIDPPLDGRYKDFEIMRKFLLLFLCLQVGPAFALGTSTVASSSKLRVGISSLPPFVMLGDTPTGYSIDLWENIASALGRDFEYVAASGVSDKLKRLRRGEIDLAIGGISISRAREEQMDFSHPVMESGLGILIRSDGLSSVSMFSHLWTVVSKSASGIGLAFLLLVIISGHLIWWAERTRDSFSDKYSEGVLEGMYWAVVTASTVGYGDKAPVRWLGRGIAVLLIVISLPMFALFTAELTSAFTVHELSAQINGLEDLRGRKLAVVRGTTSAQYISSLGLGTTQYKDIDALFSALKDEQADAIIHDAPALRYFSQTAGKSWTSMIDPGLQSQKLGIAVPAKSSLREAINRQLLAMQESGALKQLSVKWLGQ